MTIPAAWRLELGEPYESPHAQLVAPARLPDGTVAVVKVQLPDDVESVHEAEALQFWDGQGAVRLLAHAPAARALLIEECVPGTPLGDEYDDDAIAVAAEVVRMLWRPPSDEPPWRRLDLESDRWLVELPGRWRSHGQPFERRLLEAGVDAIRTLARTQEEVVLCHQDLHGGNILRAQREPWLAIDPKPIVAERAYDTVALVRDHGSHGLRVRDVRRRLDLLAELLELDRERMRGWGVAKHLAWGLEEDRVNERDIEDVRLLLRAVA